MGFDDLDELLGGDDELEAAFRELDAQIKLDEIRAQGPKRGKSKKQSQAKERARQPGATGSSAASDPLAELKSALDGKARSGAGSDATKPRARKVKGARYLVVMCPRCGAKNRVPLERVRKSLPICGRCKTDLSFER